MGCCQSKIEFLMRQARGEGDTDNKTHPQRPEQRQMIIVSSGQKREKIVREYLELQADYDQDFLTHHLKYELSLTKLTSMKQIRRRQLVEHLWLQTLWGNIGGIKQLDIKYQAYQQTLQSAWIQRTFLDIWQEAVSDLFLKDRDPRMVRRRIAQQYMFQLYQNKQFIDSGMSSLNFMLDQTQTQFYLLVQASDQAILALFKRIKEKYYQPQVVNSNPFPQVETTTTDINLLDHFPSKSFTDPANMNYQTIYEDIQFLLQRAIDEEEVFRTDMIDLFGEGTLSCPKVKQVTQNGKKYFNACAVRRVFVKWAQNLLEKCPDIKFTKTFMKFIRSRAIIVNNFFFKSTIQETTHKLVIECLSLLIELSKYDLTSGQRRKQFTFNIYDLLRCKTKRNTPGEVVQLFRHLETVTQTKSGKRFKVIRVKNRFETINNDLLVNFIYGDVLIGEVQLKVDTAQISAQAKKIHNVNHFIYELERSIFGPTLELMMQYQDFQRPDITVHFQAQGVVVPRSKDQRIKKSGSTNRVCLQGHDMISLVGNYFILSKKSNLSEEQIEKLEYSSFCNFCDRESNVQIPYDYCYKCGCYLCKHCTQQYKKADPNRLWLSIQREDLLPAISSYQTLQSQCARNKSMVVLFWLQDSSASVLFKDYMIYHQAKILMQPGKYVPKIAQAKYSYTNEYQNLAVRSNVIEYPTLILFDFQARPVRTVIGLSWFQTPNLYMSQKLLIQGQSLDLDIICISCQKDMQAAATTEGSVCLNCFGVSKPINLPPQFNGLGVYCPEGHYRCLNCCYAALNCPSTYKDFMGGSYQSTNFVTPQLARCNRGHQTVLSKKDPTDSWFYTCFKCNCKRLFDNQHGVGQCLKCKAYLCPRCMGANIVSFRNQPVTESSMVRHFVESTAEQSCLCICERPFKKVYSSRALSIEELKEEGKINWTCYLCQRVKSEGELHLACFSCPVISQIHKKKFNFEICMRCANRAKMMLREPQLQVEEAPCVLSCPRDGHPLSFTSRNYKYKLSFSCFFCKKEYFSHSHRFYCKTCDLSCCKECREQLWRSNPPQCPQRCPQNHNLKFTLVSPKSLQFCDGCMIVMHSEGFKCEEDNYILCTNCVANKPPYFKGDYSAIAKDLFQPGQSIEDSKGHFSGEVFNGYIDSAKEGLIGLKNQLENAWEELMAD